MAITLVNPEGLPKVDMYRQVSVATGSKLVFIAGQVAVDVDGATVGVGDYATQVEQCYLNVATALAEVGASFDDVAKLTVYVVDWTADTDAAADGGDHPGGHEAGSPPGPAVYGVGHQRARRARPPCGSRGRRGHRLNVRQ